VVAKDAAEKDEGVSDNQHERDERDCLRQRQGPSAENQELHREDRPKEGHDLARGEVQRESGSHRERDPQPGAALA
jgi:hypothetical protein